MTTHFDSLDQIVFKSATEEDANTLTDQTLGRAWLIVRAGQCAGYIILTFGVDLEFGGRIGIVTDLYLEPEHRRKGCGRKALQHVEDFCRASGLRALELLVEGDNGEAQALYNSFGFRAYDRFPMSKRLTVM